MEVKRKSASQNRRGSKSIFDDDKNELEDDLDSTKVSGFRSDSRSASSNSREYKSRDVQNLSESSSDDSGTEEPPVKRAVRGVSPSTGLLDDSDQDSSNEHVSEYFDFSEIISTQQKIKDLEATKADEETGNNKSKPTQSFCISELKKGRTRRSRNVPVRRNRERNEDDQVDVSELLAMGESKTDLKEKSDDNESDTCEPGPSTENEKKEIQVRIDMPNILTKKNKKKFDMEAALKRRLNAIKRENQVYLHKVHLLCLIAHWNAVDSVLNSETLLGSALSIVPSDKFYPPKQATLEYLEKLVCWFTKKVQVTDSSNESNKYLRQSLLLQFSECKANSLKCKVMMFVCMARVLGLKCRLLVNLQPVPIKPGREDLLPVNNQKNVEESDSDSSENDDFTEVVEKVESKVKGKGEKSKDSDYFKEKPPAKTSKTASIKSEETKNKKKACTTNKKNSTKSTKSSPKSSKNESPSMKSSKKKGGEKDRRVLSSDSDDLVVKKKKKKEGSDVWSEVFLESEEKWISVDLSRGRIHCIDQIQSMCSQPVLYVIGWNGDCTFKDLTKRYAPQWLTTTRKLRAESSWWDTTIKPWKPRSSAREKEEDYQLDKILEDKPLPATISEYKNHPLYALRRHLLKFEGIYPPDAPPLGFVKSEAVYSRLCVTELHSRETWLRQAKSIRRDEKAYKIVKSRPKYDKLTGTIVSDLPLELFGHWQVEDYQPPVAVNGTVPRNDWGNVELYKPRMLPVGTVHLQIPGLLRVARKLKIDCAPALVGWEYNQGCSFPVLDGFVVCEEFKDVLLDAWNKSIDESAKREKEKVEQRVYGNWRRLIKGLIIRERLEKKYNFGPVNEPKPKKKQCKRKQKR